MLRNENYLTEAPQLTQHINENLIDNRTTSHKIVQLFQNNG